jgi:probable rRNA maturation factor
MKINLEINNVTQSPIEEGFFEAVIEKTFAQLKYDFLEDAEIGISIALVAKEEIRKLNKEYRKNDSVTDILSFPEYMSLKEIKKAAGKEKSGELFLGELILCYDDIKEYGEKEGLKLEKEIANVITHGILHLVGFEHGEEMFGIQKIVTSN